MTTLLYKNLLSCYLNSWLWIHDFKDIRVSYAEDDEFKADLEDRIIEYTILVEEDSLEDFTDTMVEYGLEYTHLSYFTYAFFHELGHLMTDYLPTEEEWDSWENALLNDDVPNSDYFKTTIEQFASKWAVWYMNRHPLTVRVFDETVIKISNLLYLINKVN